MTDELDARVAALELVFLEVMAEAPPGRIEAAIERIAAGLYTGEERLVRTHAVAMLQAALNRQS